MARTVLTENEPQLRAVAGTREPGAVSESIAGPSAGNAASAPAGASATEIADSVVPVQSRAERFTSTDPGDFPPLTTRDAAWRYTPVELLGELSEGPLDGGEYPFELSGASGVTARWVGRDDERIGLAGLPEDRPSANAWAHTERVLLVEVAAEGADASGTVNRAAAATDAGAQAAVGAGRTRQAGNAGSSADSSREAVLRRSALGDTPRAAHTIIDVAPGAHASIILRNEGQARLSENVELLIGDGANVTVVSVQEWSCDAQHLAAHFIRLGRDATLRHVVVTLGGSLVRVNPAARLAGPGGTVQLLGAYFADAQQHLEHQVYVYHEAAHTTSRVTYKGALNGEGAHAVWIGDVLIGQDATGTDSYEQNRNLVLSEGTRADSVPNLEIETGDIIGAGHASATGRLDDEQLFYLQSRGVPEAEARRLVVRAFLAEVVQQIGSVSLEEHLLEAIDAELAAALDGAAPGRVPGQGAAL